MASENSGSSGRAIQQSLVGEQLTRPKCKPPGLHGDTCENDVERVITVYYGGPAMMEIEWKVCADHADEVRETGEVRADREYQENQDGFTEVR